MNAVARALFLGTAFLFGGTQAQAYPEMIRHGYVNCTTCHASPSGGGLLTDYGRGLSKEALSYGTFFFEEKRVSDADRDEQFLYGRISQPSWLKLGGDLRALQLFKDTKVDTSARFIVMQADLEAMVDDGGRVRVLASVGRTDPRKADADFLDFIVSRRHWIALLMGPEDNRDSYQLRFGRFFPAYGLNLAEHTTVTRRRLGFDQEQETYNVEVSHTDDRFGWSGTVVLGRPDRPSLHREEGIALQGSVSIASSYKLGLNAYSGRPTGVAHSSLRTLTGAFATLGFSPQWYALAELDLTHDSILSYGSVSYVKIGRELGFGFHFFGTQEFARTSFSDPRTSFEAYSLGLQYFPRPHWELTGTFRKERSLRGDFDDVGWLLAHYYL